MRAYAVQGTATNTASATLPMITLTGGTTIRPRIYEIETGSSASPADNASSFTINRITTAGTAGSAVTPTAIDPADPASGATAGLAIFSVAPTLTAGAILLSWAQNQRATFRWVAVPGQELIVPATAANGLALMCVETNTSTATWRFGYSFYE